MQFVINGLQHANPLYGAIIYLKSVPEASVWVGHPDCYLNLTKIIDDAWNWVCQHFLTISLNPKLFQHEESSRYSSLHLRASVLIQSKRWQRIMFHPHRQVLVWRNLLLRASLSSAVWRGGQMEHRTAGEERRGSDWREREEGFLNLALLIHQ